jgi:hypothetical protein
MIFRFQTVDHGEQKLQQNVYESFRSYSPFVEGLDVSRVRRSPRETSESGNSVSGEKRFRFGASASKTKQTAGLHTRNQQTVPTLFELGPLGNAPALATSAIQRAACDNFYDHCVKDKLLDALCLREARKLGVTSSKITLRAFRALGGASFVAKELTVLISSTSQTDEERKGLLDASLTPFCERFQASPDQAMLDCVRELCRVKNASERNILESCSIARCCSSVPYGCQIALVVFQTAKLCGFAHTNLSLLSKDAVAWSSCDTFLQSEIIEASRLLQIENIVLKYCGKEAKDLFKVENPRHAVRLLDYVTKQVDRDTVIADAMSLCEAFHGLSRESAAQAILQNALVCCHTDLCVELLLELNTREKKLAERAFARFILLTEEILAECSTAIQSGCSFDRMEDFCQRASRVCSRACSLTMAAIENSITIPFEARTEIECLLHDVSLLSLRNVLLQIRKLQVDFKIYISFSDLHRTNVILDKASQLFEDVVLCRNADGPEVFHKKIAVAKRATTLLTNGSGARESDIWLASSGRVIAGLLKHQDLIELDLLADLGILSNTHSELMSCIHVCIAMAICSGAAEDNGCGNAASGIFKTVTAIALLQNWTLPIANRKMLPSISSTIGHLNVSYRAFSQCDEGVGQKVVEFRNHLAIKAWSKSPQAHSCASSLANKYVIAMRRPIISPTWYVGDGLLLPPATSLSSCLTFSKGQLSVTCNRRDFIMDLVDLARSRGAHCLALNALCSAAARLSSTTGLADDLVLADICDAFDETTVSLAERSLGGTGTGITSANIDSQQALAFLLALPRKQAYSAYRSCIPTAVKTQNFWRLRTLAHIGMVAGSGSDSNLGSDAIFSVGWRDQSTFFKQCQKLATKAKWWAVLRDYAIEFDSQHFQDMSNRQREEKRPSDEPAYAASLLPQMIAKMSTAKSDVETLLLAGCYAETFKVQPEKVVQSHIQYLLSPVTRSKVRGDLGRIEKGIRSSLRLLENHIKRCDVLRQCYLILETSDISGSEYELYNVVISLYLEILGSVLDQADQGFYSIPYEDEYEDLERRKYALEILSSFFTGDREVSRPSFFKFFPPLPQALGQKAKTTHLCGILGNRFSDVNVESVFDPLEPLETIFVKSSETEVVTNLALLYLPLGLPKGFIHARWLMSRFLYSAEHGVNLPTFDHDGSPVLKKIRSASDKEQLANWCGRHYHGCDEEKLKYLEVELESAMESSAEIEQLRLQYPDDRSLQKKESDALANVRQISLTKTALSDMLCATAILSVASNDAQLRRLSDELIQELERFLKDNPQLPPEALIDCLYDTGSKLAAEQCLDTTTVFSTAQLRDFCNTVHTACRAVSNNHSHINPNQRARHFAQRWLFYGDEGASKSPCDVLPIANATFEHNLSNIDEEDTVNFVMDLSGLQADDDGWSSGLKSRQQEPLEQKVSSKEEKSAIFPNSLELAEQACTRASLRIAFLLASSENLNFQHEDSTVSAKENEDLNAQWADGKKGSGILGKIRSRRDSKQDVVYEVSAELLQIVFAKSNTSSALSKWNSFDSLASRMEQKSDSAKTITYAMRHRALRVASILCPQEALEAVIRNEGYLLGAMRENVCTLRDIAFGCFLAKEIEEMGLPLPHPDLQQLSTMNFLSYARTLWLHHGAALCRDSTASETRSLGRLLLLLVSLSLKSSPTEIPFVHNCFEEMARLQLSRSLLLALENIVDFLDCEQSHVNADPPSFAESKVSTLAMAVLVDIRSVGGMDANNINNSSSPSLFYARETLVRLCKVVETLCKSSERIEKIKAFVFALSRGHEFGDAGSPIFHDLLEIATQVLQRAERLSNLATSAIRKDESTS